MLTILGQLESVEELCHKFLQTVKPIIPFDYGHFIHYHQDEETPFQSYSHNISDKTFEEYSKYYNRIDTFFQKSFNTFYPKRSTDIMDYHRWQKTEYFNDFHLKNDFYYVIISDVHYRSELLCSISLVRNKKGGDFSLNEVVLLQLLTPHISNHLYKLRVIEKLESTPEKNIQKIIVTNQTNFEYSDRETEIIQLIFRGFTNKKISDTLFISTETVKKHLHNIFKKSLVNNRTELIAKLINLK